MVESTRAPQMRCLQVTGRLPHMRRGALYCSADMTHTHDMTHESYRTHVPDVVEGHKEMPARPARLPERQTLHRGKRVVCELRRWSQREHPRRPIHEVTTRERDEWKRRRYCNETDEEGRYGRNVVHVCDWKFVVGGGI